MIQKHIVTIMSNLSLEKLHFFCPIFTWKVQVLACTIGSSNQLITEFQKAVKKILYLTHLPCVFPTIFHLFSMLWKVKLMSGKKKWWTIQWRVSQQRENKWVRDCAIQNRHCAHKFELWSQSTIHFTKWKFFLRTSVRGEENRNNVTEDEQ